VAAAVTTALTKIDASGFKGDTSLFFTDDKLTNVNVITGGASTKDTVNTIISNSANTFKMSAIETLSVQNTTGASSINLDGSVGLTAFILNDAAAGSGAVTLTNYDLATRLTLGAGVDTGGADATDVGVTVVVTAASATGAADTLNVTVQDIDTSAIVQANGVETINLKIAADAAGAQLVSVSDTNATNKFGVNVTDGTSAIGFTLNGLTSDATSVNASTFIGNLTFTAAARAGTTAMTITGGVGTDALNMKQANDVIDGGTGTDTLSIVQNAVLGGFLVDLSSTVDQITTYNGSANNAVQKGFENIDMSGITGTFGADITARAAGSSIVGTGNADVISGGAGVDTITGGVGIDAMTGGAGDDIFIIVGSAQAVTGNAAIDQIDGGAGTGDELRLSTATTIAATDVLTRITNVEKITSDANAGIISLTLSTASQAGTSFTTVDLSGDTDATADNVINLANGGAVTGITAVTGGAGIETITLGAVSNAATLIGGGGVDVFALAATNNATVGYAAAADVATNNTIGGFTIGSDFLAFAAALVTGSAAGTLVAADYLETGAAAHATAATEATNIATAIDAVANVATANIIVLLDTEAGTEVLDATSIAAGTLASGLLGSGFVLAVESDDALTTAILYFDADFNAAGGLIVVGTITLSAAFDITAISQANFTII